MTNATSGTQNHPADVQGSELQSTFFFGALRLQLQNVTSITDKDQFYKTCTLLRGTWDLRVGLSVSGHIWVPHSTRWPLRPMQLQRVLTQPPPLSRAPRADPAAKKVLS